MLSSVPRFALAVRPLLNAVIRVRAHRQRRSQSTHSQFHTNTCRWNNSSSPISQQPSNPSNSGFVSSSSVSSPSVSPSSSASPQSQQQLPRSPTYGLPVRDNLPEFDWEEVYKHDNAKSYWYVLDGYVYDLTSYASKHPGGNIESLFQYGHGSDRGAAFAEMHGFKEKRASSHFLIGRIKAGSVSTRTPKPRPVPTLELEDDPLAPLQTDDAPESNASKSAKQ